MTLSSSKTDSSSPKNIPTVIDTVLVKIASLFMKSKQIKASSLPSHGYQSGSYIYNNEFVLNSIVQLS